MKTWHTFAVLIITAVLIAFRLHYIILLIATLYLLFRLWIAFAIRHPYAAWFVIGFIRGLMGRR